MFCRMSLVQDYGSSLPPERDGYWRRLKSYFVSLEYLFEAMIRLNFDSLYLGIFDSSHSFFVFVG